MGGVALPLLIVWPEAIQPCGPKGTMVGLMANSEWVYAKGDLPGLLLPVPHPCGERLLTHTSTGGLPTLVGSFGSVSCGDGHHSFPLGLGAIIFCLCPPRLESLFLPVLQKSYNQIPQPSE